MFRYLYMPQSKELLARDVVQSAGREHLRAECDSRPVVSALSMITLGPPSADLIGSREFPLQVRVRPAEALFGPACGGP